MRKMEAERNIKRMREREAIRKRESECWYKEAKVRERGKE